MFYRGADLRSLNSNEFLDRTIDGERVPVYEVDFPEGVTVEDYKNQSVHNFGEYITSSEEVAITGGLTDNLPAAIKFTKQVSPPGLVLLMDETNIPSRVESIQYDPDWFDRNPGVLAHVTDLHDGELREGGQIVGLLSVREDKTVLSEYRRREIVNNATANRYTTEREVVAFDDDIYIDHAVQSMAMYLGTTGVSPYTILHSLTEMPGYRSKLGDVFDIENREVVARNEEYRKQAELLYEEVRPLIDYDEAPFYLVAVESRNDVRSGDGRIEPDNFRFVYNGREFDTDYSRNSELLGGG